MPIIINTNTSSLNAQRLLSQNSGMVAKSLEKLASGYRINRAGDDAAGLQISESLRAQIRGSKKALDNVQDGINFLQYVDGALQTEQDIVQRIRELMVQAANDTYRGTGRAAIREEVNRLMEAIQQIAQSTQFNGRFPISPNSSTLIPSFMIQAGPNGTSNDQIDLSSIIGRMDRSGLGLGNTPLTAGNFSTSNQALDFIRVRIDLPIQPSGQGGAMAELNERRATIGAMINRLEAAAANLSIGIENLSASESRIRNADVAAESAALTRHQILQQSSATVLTQANQSPSIALQLIRGQK
ncbi:MAG: flagellin [Candidatus Melainabacteria bacterium]